MARRYIMNVVPHVFVFGIFGVRSWLAGDYYILIVLMYVLNLLSQHTKDFREATVARLVRISYVLFIYLFLFESTCFSTC